MRLIAPLLFVLVGVLVAVIVHALFPRSRLTLLHSALLGTAGSIGGIWLSDALDTLGVGVLNGALFPAVLGAVVLTVVGNTIGSLINRKG